MARIYSFGGKPLGTTEEECYGRLDPRMTMMVSSDRPDIGAPKKLSEPAYYCYNECLLKSKTHQEWQSRGGEPTSEQKRAMYEEMYTCAHKTMAGEPDAWTSFSPESLVAGCEYLACTRLISELDAPKEEGGFWEWVTGEGGDPWKWITGDTSEPVTEEGTPGAKKGVAVIPIPDGSKTPAPTATETATATATAAAGAMSGPTKVVLGVVLAGGLYWLWKRQK